MTPVAYFGPPAAWFDLIAPEIHRIFEAHGCTLVQNDNGAFCYCDEMKKELDFERIRVFLRDDNYAAVQSYAQELAEETNLVLRTFDWPLWGAALRREILKRKFDVVFIAGVHVERGVANYTEDFDAP